MVDFLRDGAVQNVDVLGEAVDNSADRCRIEERHRAAHNTAQQRLVQETSSVDGGHVERSVAYHSGQRWNQIHAIFIRVTVADYKRPELKLFEKTDVDVFQRKYSIFESSFSNLRTA